MERDLDILTKKILVNLYNKLIQIWVNLTKYCVLFVKC